MKVVVGIDLIATMILPASFCYAVYLLFLVFFEDLPVSTVLLVLYAIIMGVQIVVFVLRSRWDYLWWFFIYFTVGLPVFYLILPVYSFWNMDDFSWGKTRAVGGNAPVGAPVAAEEDDEEDDEKEKEKLKKYRNDDNDDDDDEETYESKDTYDRSRSFTRDTGKSRGATRGGGRTRSTRGPTTRARTTPARIDLAVAMVPDQVRDRAARMSPGVPGSRNQGIMLRYFIPLIDVTGGGGGGELFLG